MNKCTDCKTQISPYQVRCYKCHVAHYDAMSEVVMKPDWDEEDESFKF